MMQMRKLLSGLVVGSIVLTGALAGAACDDDADSLDEVQETAEDIGDDIGGTAEDIADDAQTSVDDALGDEETPTP